MKNLTLILIAAFVACPVFGSRFIGADIPAPSAFTPPVLRTEKLPAKYLPRYRNWQGIPSIERSSGGRLWAAWYGGIVQEGREGNYIVVYTSGDDGATWQGPVAVFDGLIFCNGTSFDPRLFKNAKGEPFLTITRTMTPTVEKKHVTSWVFKAEDPEDPLTKWGKATLLGCGISLNKPLIFDDGRMLFPLDTRKPQDGNASRLAWVISDDGGKSYKPFSSVEVQETPENYPLCEHQAAMRPDGSLLMFSRAKYGIASAESFDGGKTWKNFGPFTTEFCKNTRFALARLKSGNLLLVANDAKGRDNMTAFLSKDGGKTWPFKISIDPRARVSYPDYTLSEDGFIYIIYDRGRYTPDEQDILMAKITEADIEAGKIVSEGSKLQVMVNTLKDSGGGARAQYEYSALEKAYQEQIDSLRKK